jgi:hypothetical protein
MIDKPDHTQWPHAFYVVEITNIGFLRLTRPSLFVHHVQLFPWNDPQSDEHRTFIRQNRFNSRGKVRSIRIKDWANDPDLGLTSHVFYYYNPEIYTEDTITNPTIGILAQYMQDLEIKKYALRSKDKPSKADLRQLERKHNCVFIREEMQSYNVWNGRTSGLPPLAVLNIYLLAKGNIPRLSSASAKSLKSVESHVVAMDHELGPISVINHYTDSDELFAQLQNGKKDFPALWNQNASHKSENEGARIGAAIMKVSASELWDDSGKEIALPPFLYVFDRRPTQQETYIERQKLGLILN